MEVLVVMVVSVGIEKFEMFTLRFYVACRS